MSNNTLKPHWILVARGHVRGCEAITLKFSMCELDKMITASMHLRAIGYTLIKNFPARERLS